MPSGDPNFFNVVVIDPASGACLSSVEFSFPIRDVRDAMERAPDVERDGFLAWGRITRAELELMLQLLGDDDDRHVLETIPFERGFCSLFWSR